MPRRYEPVTLPLKVFENRSEHFHGDPLLRIQHPAPHLLIVFEKSMEQEAQKRTFLVSRGKNFACHRRFKRDDARLQALLHFHPLSRSPHQPEDATIKLTIELIF